MGTQLCSLKMIEEFINSKTTKNTTKQKTYNYKKGTTLSVNNYGSNCLYNCLYNFEIITKMFLLKFFTNLGIYADPYISEEEFKIIICFVQ